MYYLKVWLTHTHSLSQLRLDLREFRIARFLACFRICVIRGSSVVRKFCLPASIHMIRNDVQKNNLNPNIFKPEFVLLIFLSGLNGGLRTNEIYLRYEWLLPFLTHSIWEIQPSFTSQKWNMDEIFGLKFHLWS